MYYKKIEGEKINLSPINSDDYEIYTNWMNNYDTAKFITQYTNIITEKSEKDYLERIENEKYNFAIVVKENNKLVGNISLMDYDQLNQRAELGIFIGNSEDRHKGYGTEAIQLLLNYAFNYLNLNNIFLKVYDLNKNAINVYKKIGFKQIGKRHECFYFNGQLTDEIYMEILKKEYIK